MKKTLLPIICVLLSFCVNKNGKMREECKKLSFCILPAKPLSEKVFPGDPKIVGLTCILRNHSKDTVCFTRFSCNGLHSFINYDKSAFRQSPVKSCNLLRPMQECLPPGGVYIFNYELSRLKDTKELRLFLDLDLSESKDSDEAGKYRNNENQNTHASGLWSNKIDLK
jgi:hypothetical protein